MTAHPRTPRRSAARHARPAHGPRIGLALAGGGPLGAIYEIGALCALDEALEGLDFTHLHGYVGVSAGGFIAAGLANGMTPRGLCRSFIENVGHGDDVFDPADLAHPAWGEFARRLRQLPALAASSAWQLVLGRSRMSALEQLGRVLPAGLLDNEPLHAKVERMFSAPGRSNDFRTLPRRLVLVATDLDTGEAAPLGLPGFDHVPISRAVQASAALPGLFPPVQIDGRYYVDGALKKTLHASVLLEQGIDLLLCLNPLVPFDSQGSAGPPQGSLTPAGGGPGAARTWGRAQGSVGQAIPRLVDGGLPVVLSQTFRSMIHSRLELGMRRYEHLHPDTDIVLFEPDHRDARMFLANTFSYSQRRQLAEHAYQSTRAMLRERRAELGSTLARHGVRLRHEVLDDASRVLLDTAAARLQRCGPALQRLDTVLDELEQVLAPGCH
jgi:NTE family protein